MTIAWLRDLVIIIAGIIGIVASIMFTVFSYSIYRRISQIVESLKTTSSALEQVCSSITELQSQPVNLAISFFQGVQRSIDSITKVFQKEG